MAVTQYIGAAYVAHGWTTWDAQTSYDNMYVVEYQNGNYISKKNVPPGVSPAGNQGDNEYWAWFGVKSAQIEGYRQEVADVKNAVADVQSEQNIFLKNSEYVVPKYLFSYVQSMLDNETINTNLPVEIEAITPLSKNQFIICVSARNYNSNSAEVIIYNCTITNFKVNVLKETTLTGLWHANDSTLINGVLYIACGGDSNKIVALNPNTLSVLNEYSFNATQITNDGEKLIGLINNDIYYFDVASNTSQYAFTLQTDIGFQSIAYHNGVIYATGGDHLVLYGYNNMGEKIFTTVISEFTDMGHKLQYSAGMEFYDDTLFASFNIVTGYTQSNIYTNNAQYAAIYNNYVCSISLTGNGYGYSANMSQSSGLYLANFKTGFGYYSGTAAAPLIDVGEAILHYAPKNIIVVGSYTYPVCLIIRNMNVSIANLSVFTTNGLLLLNSKLSFRYPLNLNSNINVESTTTPAYIIHSELFAKLTSAENLNPVVLSMSRLIASQDNTQSTIVPVCGINTYYSEVSQYSARDKINVIIGSQNQILFQSDTAGTKFTFGFHVNTIHNTSLIIAIINGKQCFGVLNYLFGNQITLSDGTTLTMGSDPVADTATLSQAAEKIIVYKIC